jgi:hypothetical protein
VARSTTGVGLGSVVPKPTPALLLIIRAVSECLWGGLWREGSETPWCPGGNKDIDPKRRESSQKPGAGAPIGLSLEGLERH